MINIQTNIPGWQKVFEEHHFNHGHQRCLIPAARAHQVLALTAVTYHYRSVLVFTKTALTSEYYQQ